MPAASRACSSRRCASKSLPDEECYSARRSSCSVATRSPSSGTSRSPSGRSLASRSYGSRPLEEGIDAELSAGRHSALVPELERLVSEHELRERLRAQLMLALYRVGRQAEPSTSTSGADEQSSTSSGSNPAPPCSGSRRQILNQDDALDLGEAGGPPGTMTFLFTDIEGSTSLPPRARRAIRRGAGRAPPPPPSCIRAPRWHRGRYAGRRVLRCVRVRPRCRSSSSRRAARLSHPMAGPTARRCGSGWVSTRAKRARPARDTSGSGPPCRAYLLPPGMDARSSSRTRLARAAPPRSRSRDVGLRDLGPHRLKDLTQAERIFPTRRRGPRARVSGARHARRPGRRTCRRRRRR